MGWEPRSARLADPSPGTSRLDERPPAIPSLPRHSGVRLPPLDRGSDSPHPHRLAAQHVTLTARTARRSARSPLALSTRVRSSWSARRGADVPDQTGSPDAGAAPALIYPVSRSENGGLDSRQHQVEQHVSLAGRNRLKNACRHLAGVSPPPRPAPHAVATRRRTTSQPSNPPLEGARRESSSTVIPRRRKWRLRHAPERRTDGNQIGQGDVASIAPGHDAWVMGEEPCIAVDFGGYSQYAKG